MPIFEKPGHDTIPPIRERWTPIYLEHGRVEVDDSSVKWIGADKTILRIPVSTLSVLMLGPGTTITHAAIKACADCDTPVCWVGGDGLHFYAGGAKPTHDNANARLQAELASAKKTHEMVARKMFALRFKDVDVSKYSVNELRGFEGRRIKKLYSDMGARFGVTWKGRNYNIENWHIADSINKAVSAANAALYALTTSVVFSLGYLPQLGFIHTAGSLPFVFDIADIYKPETTLPAAFESVRDNPDADEEFVMIKLKRYIEECNLLKRMPTDIADLLRKS